jgi:hypothetical protein
MGDQKRKAGTSEENMSSRSTIIVTAAIATLAFGATDAFARGGHSGGHVGGFHHHRGSFVGGGYVPYDDDYCDEDSCPIVRVRVKTAHGLRWRWMRSCTY